MLTLKASCLNSWGGQRRRNEKRCGTVQARATTFCACLPLRVNLGLQAQGHSVESVALQYVVLNRLPVAIEEI